MNYSFKMSHICQASYMYTGNVVKAPTQLSIEQLGWKLKQTAWNNKVPAFLNNVITFITILEALRPQLNNTITWHITSLLSATGGLQSHSPILHSTS